MSISTNNQATLESSLNELISRQRQTSFDGTYIKRHHEQFNCNPPPYRISMTLSVTETMIFKHNAKGRVEIVSFLFNDVLYGCKYV